MSNVIPWEIEANRFDFPSAAYFDSGVNKCFVPRGDPGHCHYFLHIISIIFTLFIH